MEPTRWRDGQKSNTLYLLFTNRDGLISNTEVLPPVGKSDHGVLLFKVHCNYSEIKEPIKRTMWDRGDYTALQNNLKLNWSNLHIPVFTFQSERRFRQIWMTSECIKKVKDKCKSWRIYMKTKHRNDKLKYCRIRNQSRWSCRKAEKDFEKKVAQNVKKNPKAFWRYVNSKLKYKEVVADLNIDGNLATTDTEKANALSNFFKDVFTKEDCSRIPDIPDKPVNSPLEDITFTQKDAF